jgi:plasmid stabilization system protein ParE
MAYVLATEAQQDLENIVLYWLRQGANGKEASRKHNVLRANLKAISVEKLEDQTHPELDRIKKRLTKDKNFLVYFERIDPTVIFIIRIWPAKGQPITTEALITMDRPPTSTSSLVELPAPVEKTAKSRNQSLSFEAVMGEAPANSVEYQLGQGQGAGLLTRDIEQLIECLQNSSARKGHTDGYSKLAIAYLQGELDKRRRGE